MEKLVFFSDKELNDQTIGVLRPYARSLGLKPGTKKKADLIAECLDRITEIKKGSYVMNNQHHKQVGRPSNSNQNLIFKQDDSFFESESKESMRENKKEVASVVKKEANTVAKKEANTVAKKETASVVKKEAKKLVDKEEIQKVEVVNVDLNEDENLSDKPDERKSQDRSVNNNFHKKDNNKEPSIEDFEIKEGVLEIMQDGYGFLRAKNYESSSFDAYVSAQKIKKCALRRGDWIKAEAKKTCENRPAGVINILEVNGRDLEQSYNRRNFDTLTPIYPEERYRLEIPNVNNDFAIRAIDMIAPIGKGQRAMIVSPPKAGKTTLLKKIANSISVNYPEAHLLVLLIDERPEEVTDMQRSIKGEVVYSTFDEMPDHHTKAAELVLDRAKRLVELGDNVIILMDSLTRLARAYNLTIAPTGRTLSGGIDPGALHSPKRFFGAARNIEFGGSLTIIATALVDTGSKMDDVIYEEFKGTGNMEVHLDRKLSEKRIFPAIDLNRSGTRREELLLTPHEMQAIWGMRKILSAGDVSESTERLINSMLKTKTNEDYFKVIENYMKRIESLKKQGHTIK
ncbi:MAG: transcription termination factor Rho [Clostridia bacterium]